MKKNCLGCDSEFETTSWNHKYCNKECFNKSRRMENPFKTKQCLGCNKEFVSKAPNTKYCNVKCRQIVYNKKTKASRKKLREKGLDRQGNPIEVITKQCKVCDKEFTISGPNKHTKVFCSKKCLRYYHCGSYKRLNTKKECAFCEKEFTPKKRTDEKYCSMRCRKDMQNKKDHLARKKNWKKICAVCSKVFESKFKDKTCSEECSKIRARNLRPKYQSNIQPAIKRICECGKEFEAVGHGRSRMSCSKKCADKRRNKQATDWHHETKVLKIKKCLYCDKTFNPHGKQKTCGSKECKKKLDKDWPSLKINYRERDVEKARKREAKYRKRNGDRIRAYSREYSAKRKQNPKHRLSDRMYGAVRRTLKQNNIEESTTEIINILYTKQDLYEHIESLFTDGMSWERFDEIHIDHIRPVASFNYTTTDCEDFKKCWALENLQPLWATDNLSKGSEWQGKRWRVKT